MYHTGLLIALTIILITRNLRYFSFLVLWKQLSSLIPGSETYKGIGEGGGKKPSSHYNVHSSSGTFHLIF